MSKTRALLPREHGFWTMLAAVVLVAVARSELSLAVLLVAGAVVVVAVVLGSVFRRSIRQHVSLQLAAAAVISLGDVPIEVAGKLAPAAIALTVLALAVTFVSSALSVRASFARASRRQLRSAQWFERGAVLLPCLAAILFVVVGASAHVVAALVALVGSIVLGVKRPGVKQMKATGLFLAGVTAVAAGVLGSL